MVTSTAPPPKIVTVAAMLLMLPDVAVTLTSPDVFRAVRTTSAKPLSSVVSVLSIDAIEGSSRVKVILTPERELPLASYAVALMVEVPFGLMASGVAVTPMADNETTVPPSSPEESELHPHMKHSESDKRKSNMVDKRRPCFINRSFLIGS